MPTSLTGRTDRQRRELGALYTPSEVVRFMVRSCLRALVERGNRPSNQPITMLDPACGDGAFLVGAARIIAEFKTCGWQGQQRSEWPRSSTSNRAGPSTALLTPPLDIVLQERGTVPQVELYGVDIDARAIDTLERRRADQSSLSGIQFVRGNALTGPAFGETSSANHTGLDWSQAFPDVGAEGGFDLIMGNPPYLREKDAKGVFDTIAASPLGRRWRQPRMDLWHYFLHRGLDLLKPGGVLSFILNSYWTSATSARGLIERLCEQTTIEQIVLLGDKPIFAGVSGRHMILQLSKGRKGADCHVLDLSGTTDVLGRLSQLAFMHESMGIVQNVPTWTQSQTSLYDTGRLVVTPIENVGHMPCSLQRLSDRFLVRQGIAENPPFVTRSMSEESGGSQPVGMGVFVLTDAEVAALELSEYEKGLLRPYFATASIRRYAVPVEPTHWLLYLTRHTAPKIARLSAIERHLRRFRMTLDRRREVQRGAIAWWHLHWPRRESLFTKPRILAVQMGRRPTFVYAERPTFVGFSTNVVQTSGNHDEPVYSLPALTAILNSQHAARWFTRHAKQRGVHLDISGTVLRDFPIPPFDRAVEDELTRLCLQRHSIPGESADFVAGRQLDAEIDRIVAATYGRSLLC